MNINGAFSLAGSLLAMPALVFSARVLGIDMQSVEFSPLPEERGMEIRMLFDEVPPEPTGYTIKEPARIVLDLAGVESRLPRKRYSLGESDAITVLESGNRTRIVVSMDELPVWNARVEGKAVYLTLGAAGQADGKETAPASKFSGEKLSLNFQDIDVRSVLQILADFTGLNLVVSDSVTGRITLRLQHVPWDQALDIIMKTRGLDQRLVGNVLMIAPATELQALEQVEAASRQQTSRLAPLHTEFIVVKYANAAGIIDLFQSGSAEASGEGLISPRGSVLVDERTNSVIITETRARIRDFQELVERLDVPVRQVLIEARIVTATTSFGESLGVRWGALGFDVSGNGKKVRGFGGSLTTLQEIRKSVSDDKLTYSQKENLIVDLPTAGKASSFAYGVIGEDYLLDMELFALETEGHGEVIARPRVITADRQTASIVAGDQIPYQEASSSGATSTQFIDAVLGLKVTPRITPDDRIIMDLDISQDSIGAIFNGVPSVKTNSIQTRVLVKDGETIVLGGVFQTVVSESVSKTPLLGDIPLLGRLFKQTTRSDDKQELLIFITPRLIRDSQAQEQQVN